MEYPCGLNACDDVTLHLNILRAAAQLLGIQVKDLRLTQSDIWMKLGKETSTDKPLDNNNQRVHCGKTVLITGAAGSIGSEIVRQVLMFSPKVILMLDQAETPLHELTLETQALEKDTIIYSVIADVRSKKAMEVVFATYRPDVVYHAAAYKHVPLMEENPAQAIVTNVKGTKNVADMSCKYGADKFVMVSTDKAVNPSNVMGASKRIAEKYVQSLQWKHKKEDKGVVTKFITTRFGNVLGSNGSVVPLFTKQISEGGPVTITHKDIIRYFMTIPEACQLVLEAGAMGKGGEIYIFDMGKPVKIYDLAQKMIKLAGFIPNVDIKIDIVGLRPGEKLFEELLNNSAKTIPTHHEKIMIAQEIEEEFEELHQDIIELITGSDVFDNDAIVSQMKKIVPEFKSMNSTFEVLDK
jgi:FlaA1/EpsC-like NDP-sugar epimerase